MLEWVCSCLHKRQLCYGGLVFFFFFLFSFFKFQTLTWFKRVVLLNKLKHTGRYIKREENNSESQQASRIQSHCGGPGVNSPSQTYVHHCESSNSYPQSWPCPPPPHPPKQRRKYQKHLPAPPTVRDGSKLPLRGNHMLTLILGYHVLFGNSTGRVSEYWPKSSDLLGSARLCWGVFSMCPSVSWELCPSGTISAWLPWQTPHKGLARAFFDRLIMLGWNSVWRRACLVRWSLLMNLFSHSGQRNCFSPVWVR